MLVVHGGSHPSTIMQDRYVAKLMARRRISLSICYIIFKTRIGFQEHMKWSALLLRPGPGPGGFVREFMLLLNGISEGGQITREREKRFTSVMSVIRLMIPCKPPTSKKFGSTEAMCLSARDVVRSLRPYSINSHKKLVCGKPHHRKSFCNFSMSGKGHRKWTVLGSSRKRTDIPYPWWYVRFVKALLSRMLL